MSQMFFCFNVPKVGFGRFDFGDLLNSNAASASFSGVLPENYNSYKEDLIKSGFSVFESRNISGNCFDALHKGNDAVYISYYEAIKEMRIVTEKNSAYINYSDKCRDINVKANITQINLLDFGLSYVIRLSDGRFIVFDGGWDWEEESDKLMDVLKKFSVDDKPVIAAWFLTHQHCDHYWNFVTFHGKYGNEVVIEKVLYSFAEPTDEFIEKYPGSFLKNARGTDYDFTVRFLKCVEECGAKVFCPHSGQRYQIGNALCEILSCPDDTCRTPVTDANPLSLMIKMTIEGQSVLWCADGYFEQSKLVERYGNYLKADIMQLPHHGFNGATSIGYDFIAPKVVLAPTFDDDAFVYINIHSEFNRHLCAEIGVEEYICGKKYNGENRTIDLPYTPSTDGKSKLANMIKDGQGFRGARVWYFDSLCFRDNDPCFVNIIRSGRAMDVFIDVICEDPKYGATAIRVDTKKSSYTKFNLNGINLIENNPVQFERTFRRKSEIPKDVQFAIRVYASEPFVASCDTGREIYHY